MWVCYTDEVLGTERDAEEAFYWLRQAAEAGNVSAQGSLGELYELGDGVEQFLRLKPRVGIRRLQRRAIAGRQNALGLLYEEGLGVTQSVYRGCGGKWYQLVCRSGECSSNKQI